MKKKPSWTCAIVWVSRKGRGSTALGTAKGDAWCGYVTGVFIDPTPWSKRFLRRRAKCARQRGEVAGNVGVFCRHTFSTGLKFEHGIFCTNTHTHTHVCTYIYIYMYMYIIYLYAWMCICIQHHNTFGFTCLLCIVAWPVQWCCGTCLVTSHEASPSPKRRRLDASRRGQSSSSLWIQGHHR